MIEAITNKNYQNIDPETFSKKYQADYDNGLIYPVCPNCERRLYLCAIHSIKRKAYFKHPKESGDCEFLGIKKAKNFPSYDFNNNKIIEELENQENIKRIYAICLELIGKRSKFKHKEMRELIDIAKRKNIFYYKGLEIWMIPYILLTLKDFSIWQKDRKKTYQIRFVMKNILIKILTKQNIKNKIQKVFSDSGKIISVFQMTKNDFYSIDITDI